MLFLVSLISLLISSRDIVDNPFCSTILRICKNAFFPVSRDVSIEVLSMVKGILLLLTTARTKILKAVLELIPNSEQSFSKELFKSESKRNVNADCAMFFSLIITNVVKLFAMCKHFDCVLRYLTCFTKYTSVGKWSL